MAVRMDKPWIPLTAENVAKLTAHLGVYQLADAQGEIVYIGVAGGRTLFGLKGELQRVLQAPPAGAAQFRFEANMAYRTRHEELLAVFLSDNEKLPKANSDLDPRTLGRIRPG
ncbi:MAG: hypothetical protein K0U93_01365 [Gammaproteobacteria bacterium]|nr:hypothetical protein [Gammaproteobacteria bacterium]